MHDGGNGWSTSAHLLASVRENQPLAWDRFNRLYGVLIRHWFRLGQVPEADWPDLQQEVMFAVSRGLNRYVHNPALGTFRGWLRVIVRNKICDRRKLQLPMTFSPTLDQLPAPSSDDDGLAEEKRLVFTQALSLIRTDFEETTWRAFWRVAVDDRSPAEVAAELQMSLNAVYLAKARVIRRLREEFSGLLDDDPPDAR